METQATLHPRSIPAVVTVASFALQYSNTPGPHKVTSNQGSPDSMPPRDMTLKVAKKIPLEQGWGVEGGFWLRGRAVQRRVLIPYPHSSITQKFTAGKQGRWKTFYFSEGGVTN
jgi:hypothetical protein